MVADNKEVDSEAIRQDLLKLYLDNKDNKEVDNEAIRQNLLKLYLGNKKVESETHWGKIALCGSLGAGLAVVGVAAAPFTGGGSVLGALSLGSALGLGSGIAAGAVGAAAGATAGNAWGEAEEEDIARTRQERDDLRRKNAELRVKVEKFERAYKEAISKFKGDKEFFNYVVCLVAIGVSVAKCDGKIVPAEVNCIEEFIGGISYSNYPKWVKDEISKIFSYPPQFTTAIQLLKDVRVVNRQSIRDLIEVVIAADGKVEDEEIEFLKAFDTVYSTIPFGEEVNDTESEFLKSVKDRMHV